MVDLLALVGGDARLRRALAALRDAGWSVDLVERPPEAEHRARATRVHAIAFDAALVDSDFLGRVRREHPAKVIVAWTNGTAAAADLLEGGADDVLHPGMGEREVAARLTSAVRRSAGAPRGTVELGRLRLDALHGEALWDGRDLMLTNRERAVLEVLAEHPGRTVRREIVYRRVWGYAMARGERSVDVNVKRLRAKLAAAAGGALQVKTQPGVGYRLELASEAIPERASESVTAL